MTQPIGEVSGHYAGAFSRLGAFIIDWALVVALYGVVVGGFSFVVSPLLRLGFEPESVDPVIASIFFATWVFFYFVVGLTISGRTPGKGLLGLRVVTRHGAPIGGGTAILRVLAFPLSVLTLGIGFLGVVFGRERRALHDVIAGTAVVYDWGDRPAELPAPLTRYLERKGALNAADAEEDASAAAAP